MPAPGKLRTFAGVFTPSILTILGIVLFLRLGQVVGGAGLPAALLVILAANAISALTAASVAAIATNLRVKRGGDYYLISRTLGPSFGGAIGVVLVLAQSVSVGFYCIGFAEATTSLVGWGPDAAAPVAAAAVLALGVLAWLGADWATRAQYLVMALLAAALLAFAAGAFRAGSAAQLEANWLGGGTGMPFWVAFALFFPAVTGFTQGISMSGDLAAPRRSIPRGTFAAVGLSAVVYLGCALLFAAAAPGAVLATDTAAMRGIAAFGPLVDAGVIAATLSSALASFLGAPRILQALAADGLFPSLRVFARGSGGSGNPRRGVLLAGSIALGVVALGSLDAVAAVVSMAFLVSYGLLNYATWFEARAASPSFRPALGWYRPWLSLAGGLGCLGAMLAIDLWAGAAAAAAVFAIHLHLERRDLPAPWADGRRSHHLARAREHLLAAAAEAEHPRDWRAQLLVFSDDVERRGRLVRFAAWIEGGAGLTTVVRVLAGSGPAMLARRDEAEEALAAELKALGSTAFPLVVVAPELDTAAATIVQATGTGPVRANTVVANWRENAPAYLRPLGAEGRYAANLRTAFRLGRNLLVLDADAAEWEALGRTPAAERVIDIWWHEGATGRLMLMLSYLMRRHPDWEDARVRLLAVRRPFLDEADQAAALASLLEEARIGAEPVVLASLDDMVAASEGSALVMVPFFVGAAGLRHPLGSDVGRLLGSLPIVALCTAAEDIGLDADPDLPDTAAVPQPVPDAGDPAGSADVAHDR